MRHLCQWAILAENRWAHYGRKSTQGCREAVRYLERLEEALFGQRPAGWVVVGFRKRTLVTRFGEVYFRRRLYRDESGKYHFLLDEYLTPLKKPGFYREDAKDAKKMKVNLDIF